MPNNLPIKAYVANFLRSFENGLYKLKIKKRIIDAIRREVDDDEVCCRAALRKLYEKSGSWATKVGKEGLCCDLRVGVLVMWTRT